MLMSTARPAAFCIPLLFPQLKNLHSTMSQSPAGSNAPSTSSGSHAGNGHQGGQKGDAKTRNRQDRKREREWVDADSDRSSGSTPAVPIQPAKVMVEVSRPGELSYTGSRTAFEECRAEGLGQITVHNEVATLPANTPPLPITARTADAPVPNTCHLPLKPPPPVHNPEPQPQPEEDPNQVRYQIVVHQDVWDGLDQLRKPGLARAHMEAREHEQNLYRALEASVQGQKRLIAEIIEERMLLEAQSDQAARLMDDVRRALQIISPKERPPGDLTDMQATRDAILAGVRQHQAQQLHVDLRDIPIHLRELERFRGVRDGLPARPGGYPTLADQGSPVQGL